MTAETGSLDPYRSPPQPSVEYSGLAPGRRPAWLSVVTILCIVLGALGLLNSVFGTFGMIVGPRFQKLMAARPQPGIPDDLREAQEKMQADIYLVQTKYRWELGVCIAVRVVVSSLLLIGGIRSLNMIEPGRKMLVTACCLALAFDLAQTILQMVMTMENMTIMNEFMETMGTRGGNGPKDLEPVMKTVSSIIRFFSLGLICAIALAKIAFYVFSVLYLQKPQIIALFRREAVAAPPTLTSEA